MTETTASLIRELRTKLRIDRNTLDDEVEQQAELYYMVAEKAVLAKSRKDQAEDTVKQTNAEIDVSIRKSAERNEEKITEKEIAAKIVSHPKCKKAAMLALRRREEYEKLEALQTAFRQRSYMLRDLVELYISSYYQARSIGSTSRKHTDTEVDRVRGKLAEKRVSTKRTEKRGSRARSRLKKNPNAE